MTTATGSKPRRLTDAEIRRQMATFAAVLGCFGGCLYYYGSRSVLASVLVSALVAINALAYAAVYLKFLRGKHLFYVSTSFNIALIGLIPGNLRGLCFALLAPWLISLPIHLALRGRRKDKPSANPLFDENIP